MEILQAVKNLNLISRARLNFRRQSILCTIICIEILYKRATLLAHLSDFSVEFFPVFTEDASLILLYQMQKSQRWPKTQTKVGGGGAESRKKHSFWFR